MWTCQIAVVLREGILQKVKIQEVVLTWYSENQIPNLPFLRLPWNLARMWSDVQACWNSLDPVIHFGQSKVWWPYMQHSCIQHTIDFYSWKVDGKALWFNPAFFILKSCTTTTTPDCRFYPKDATVSSLAACNTCNKKSIGDMVVTKKYDITERRRGVAIPQACPSRQFLRPTFCGKLPFGENLRDNPSPWPNIRPQQRKVNGQLEYITPLVIGCYAEKWTFAIWTFRKNFECTFSQMSGPGGPRKMPGCREPRDF